MENDVYVTVPDFQSSAGLWMRDHHQKKTRLLPAVDPPGFTRDIVSLLSKAKSGNQHLVVLAGFFTKFTRSTSGSDYSNLREHSDRLYGHLCHSALDSHPFAHRHWNSVCVLPLAESLSLWVSSIGPRQHITYHPHINRQVERFKRAIVACFWKYVPDPHTNLDRCVQHLALAYSAHVIFWQARRPLAQLCLVSHHVRKRKIHWSPSQAIWRSPKCQFPFKLNSSVEWTSSASKRTPIAGQARLLQAQLPQNLQTHSEIPPSTTGLCWQIASTNDWISTCSVLKTNDKIAENRLCI